MPLIRPEVQKVLREAGLIKQHEAVDKGTIPERLDAAGLSLDDTLNELSNTLHTTTNETLRIRIVENLLKAHGALKETTTAPPVFVINIQPATASPAASPIIQNTNPILLPRQLLSSLEVNDKSN